MVYSKTRVIDCDNSIIKIWKKNSRLPEGDIYKRLVKNNFISFCSVLLLKDKFTYVGGFSDDLDHSTDFDLFLKLSREFNIRSQNEVLCSYRVHKNSLTSKNYMSPALESIKIVSRISKNPYEKSDIKYMYATLAYAHYKYKNYFEMFKVIFKYKIFWQLLVKVIIVKLDLIPPKNF